MRFTAARDATRRWHGGCARDAAVGAPGRAPPDALRSAARQLAAVFQARVRSPPSVMRASMLYIRRDRPRLPLGKREARHVIPHSASPSPSL